MKLFGFPVVVKPDMKDDIGIKFTPWSTYLVQSGHAVSIWRIDNETQTLLTYSPLTLEGEYELVVFAKGKRDDSKRIRIRIDKRLSSLEWKYEVIGDSSALHGKRDGNQ